MSTADTRRYPTNTFTRKHLEPIESFRDIVLMRDEYRCLADAGDRSPLGRCSTTLVVASAMTPVLRLEQIRSPLFLRTFCTSHLDADQHEPTLAAAWVYRGWRIPRWIDDVDTYALLLPVLAPAGRWWLFDAWGERRPVAPEWVADLRAEKIR